MNTMQPVPKDMRDAYEATDEVLHYIEGLISALDVIEDRLTFANNLAPETKAFRVIRPMLLEKLTELWERRGAEWQAIRGDTKPVSA